MTQWQVSMRLEIEVESGKLQPTSETSRALFCQRWSKVSLSRPQRCTCQEKKANDKDDKVSCFFKHASKWHSTWSTGCICIDTFIFLASQDLWQLWRTRAAASKNLPATKARTTQLFGKQMVKTKISLRNESQCKPLALASNSPTRSGHARMHRFRVVKVQRNISKAPEMFAQTSSSISTAVVSTSPVHFNKIQIQQRYILNPAK